GRAAGHRGRGPRWVAASRSSAGSTASRYERPPSTLTCAMTSCDERSTACNLSDTAGPQRRVIVMQALLPAREAQLPFELVAALREGTAVALVGSGLSRSLGFPSWIELLDTLVGAIGDPNEGTARALQ